MRAMVITRYGNESRLNLQELPDPIPGPGDILVRVKAAGVNFADVLARLGIYDAAPKLPFAPGIEVSGTVEACGPDATRFNPGDRIMAFCAFRGYAEKVVLREAFAFPIPDDMGFPEAAALPVQYLTAYHGLIHLAHAEKGETVLVHAAAGGVGIACLQLCQAFCLKVIATVGSPSKVDTVMQECPAARIVVISHEDFAEVALLETHGHGPDIIMDSLGGKAFRKGWNILAPCGRHILFGASSAVKPGAIHKIGALWRLLPMMWVATLPMISKNKTLAAFNLYHLAGEAEKLHGAAASLLALHADGRIKPRITLSLPLEKAAEAHRRLQNRETTGKIVLTVG